MSGDTAGTPMYRERKQYNIISGNNNGSETAHSCWSNPIGIALLSFFVLALAALCVFIWIVAVRIDDADNTNALNAELVSNTRILEVVSAFARTVTRQDWEGNVELFAEGSTIDYHRVMTFLSGGPDLPTDTTTPGGWGQQLSVFAGGFTSNHMMLSNCNISYTDPITADVVCTGMYTYSLRYSTSVSTINYPTQFIVFQSLFDMADPFAHNEWIITNAVALVNATNTLLNSIETGVAPPGAFITRRGTHAHARFDIVIWQTLLAQIAQLVAVGQVDTALAICRTPQYIELMQVYDPAGTDPNNKCNTETPMPVTFTSPVMCTENGLIDFSCFNGTDGPVTIPDRVRSINMILPQPSMPAMSNSLDFSITGGSNVAVTGGMHGITLDVLAVTSVDLTMPSNVYAVTGVPVTSNGTIDVTFVNQLQGYVFAGPPSGSGAPTFRVLALTELSGVLSVLNGGTGNNATYDGNRFIVSNSDGSTLTELASLDTGFFYVGTGTGNLPAPGTLMAGDRITINMLGDSFVISGELVLLVVPADLFQDVSFNDTLAFEVVPQLANYVWAGPESGGPGLPAFRLLVSEDIPAIDLSDPARVTGVLGVANGGTNNAGPYAGDRIIMSNISGTSLVEGTLIGINGITITSGPGAFVVFDGAGTNQGTCNGGCGAVNATDVFCNANLNEACIPPRIRLINGIAPTAYPVFDFSILAGTAVSITPGTSSITIDNTGVTSVSLSLPASTFSITVVTVTTTGTLTATFIAQPANTFFAGPDNGPNATPTWRLIDFADLPPGNDGDVYYVSGSGVVEATPLSLKLEVPSALFSVTGSPITNPNGTFTITLNTQTANRFWAGPVTGAATQPTFRDIDLEDFTPLLLADGELLIGSTGGAPIAATLTAGANIVISNAGGFIMIDAIVPAELTTLVAGTGISIFASGNNTVVSNTGVTSVGLSLPLSVFSISVGTVTTTGTLTATFISQTAARFFASPSGAAGVPTFRAIALADMPALPDGYLYIGNGGVPTGSQLTAGALISITPGMGTITVGSTALGSVTLNMPTAIFDVGSVAGTNTQTLTVTFDTQTANTVFAGPTTGIPATPTMRALVNADIPSLDASKITTGTLPIARGGTNSASALANGRLMVSSAGAIVEGTSSTTPSFSTAWLQSSTNQLLIGLAASVTVSIIDTGTLRTYTLPNVGANSNFVMDSGGTMLITDAPAGAGEALISTSTTASNWRPLVGTDISSGTPTFTRATLSATTTQLTLGTTNTVTISSLAPATSRTYTLHDAGANANFVLSQGTAQTITDTAAAGDYLVATSATASNWAPLTVTNQYVEDTVTISAFGTASYTTVTSMTFSLTAGTWICSFSTTMDASNASGVDVAIFLNGVINQSSERTSADTVVLPIQTQARLVPVSTVTADVRWQKNGGGSVDMFERNFYCFKVG